MSDFFLPVIVSARIDNPVIAAFQQVLIKAQQTMAWLPNLTGEAVSMFYASPPKYPNLNFTPEGLDDDQLKQWQMVWKAMQPISSGVLRGEMQLAQIEGARLAQDVAFWDGVRRVTLAVATVGLSEVEPIVEEKWKELRATMGEWKKTRAWALKVAEHKDCPADKAAQVRQKIADLDGSITGKIASLTSQLPGLQTAVEQDGLGAIAALAALATIKTAVLIAAIIAVVAVIVYCISSIKSVINDLGLSAIGKAVSTAQNMLGPWLGVGILGLVGFILYKKFAQPKTVLRIGR